MDQKTWLWRKKSSEKVIAVAAADKVNASSNASEDEIHKLVTEKTELEREFIALNDRLTDALSELYAKDDLIKKHEKMVWDATTGWENAEAKVLSLQQELDEAFQNRLVGEERMDAALKECMQQLRFVRDDQERRIHDAVLKTTQEFERSQLILEEKLQEATAIRAENTQLAKALLLKEKFADELSKQKARLEADFNSLVKKLESTERDNSSLMYEVRVLQKELDIRSEEKEFNQRTADASHKQHLESVKKIAKLEAECQRLRVLVRKRLPGPAALAKMKSEVEFLGRDGIDARRRRSNSNTSGVSLGYAADSSSDSKRISFLTEQLCAIDEENKSLREALNKKANELQFSRSMYARTASKLSQVESHLEDLSQGHSILESSANGPVTQELYLASMSDIGSEDKVSCAGSWASALISELEHFKSGKHRGSPSSRTAGASDINLMDDFVEMERLAIVSVDKQYGSPHASSVDTAANTGLLEADLNGYSSDVTGKEIVPISDFVSAAFNHKTGSKDVGIDKSRSWLHGVVKDIWEQHCVTHRQPDQILEDVRLALRSLHPASVEAKESFKHSEAKPSPFVNGSIDDPAATDAAREATDVLLVDKSNELVQSDLRQSLCKIIELIEGIKAYSADATSESFSKKDGSLLPFSSTEVASGYMVRVFQWKVSELSPILQQFVHICYDLLNGKSNWTSFTRELNAALEWIINHCFSIQDVSSMKDAIKKHLDWDETRSECDAEVGGTVNQASEVEKSSFSNGQFSFLPIGAASNEQSKNEHQGYRNDKRLIDEIIRLESEKKEVESMLQSAVEKVESLTNQLQDSERTIESLRMELQTQRGSGAEAENQIENHKLMREDLNTQLTVAKAELDDTRQKFSCLEVELENKSCCCEELEATCLDLQLQLESVKKEALPVNQVDQEESQLRNDWEINAASAKLAECQETIVNLGKQLKSLASPRDAAMFNKVIPALSHTDGTPAAASSDPDTAAPVTTTTTSSVDVTASKSEIFTQRSSLLDRMMEEDDVVFKKDTPSTKIKESGKHSHPTFVTNEVIDHLEKILMLDGNRSQKSEVGVKSLAIVPSKRKGGGSLWKKLWRKRKSGSKKPSLPFAP